MKLVGSELKTFPIAISDFLLLVCNSNVFVLIVIYRHFVNVSLKSILAEALNDEVFTPDGYRGND